MSYCLLFYFTKSLNPISFLILFLSAIWTHLMVLTFDPGTVYFHSQSFSLFINRHFTHCFFVLWTITSTVSLNKVSYSSSAFCWHFKSSSFTLIIIHFTTSRIISFYFFISFVFMRKLPLPLIRVDDRLHHLSCMCCHIHCFALLWVLLISDYYKTIAWALTHWLVLFG